MVMCSSTESASYRIKGLTENTYKIFETTPVLGVFGRYTPTDDTMTEAIDFFRQQIASTNKDTKFVLKSDKYYEDAKSIVDRILEEISTTDTFVPILA